MDTESVPACCDGAAEPGLCYTPPTHYTVTLVPSGRVTVTPEQLSPLLATTFGVLPALVSTPNVARDMDTGKRGAAYWHWRAEIGPELAANMEKWDVIADSAWDAAWTAATERAAGIAEAEKGDPSICSTMDVWDIREAQFYINSTLDDVAAAIRGEG